MNRRRSLPLEPGGSGYQKDAEEDEDGGDMDRYGPTISNSFKKLKAALVGYNPLVGDIISEGHNPGMKRRIFEVDNFGKRVSEKALSFISFSDLLIVKDIVEDTDC